MALSDLNRSHGAFPPNSGFLLVPRAPRRAAVSSLALYEAVLPQQRLALAVSRAAFQIGLANALPSSLQRQAGIDLDWWKGLLQEVVAPIIGKVTAVAFRLPPNGRTAALVMSDSFRSAGFIKQTPQPVTDLVHGIDQRLEDPGTCWQAPRVFVSDTFRSVNYRFSEAIEGAHWPLPPHDRRWLTVIREFQERTSDLLVGPATSTNAVVCHSDFTPRNLRVGADGRVRLIDWDNARFGPRLVDPLHYLCADVGWRGGSIAATVWRVVSTLREIGTDEEILAAAEWSDAPKKAYRPVEVAIREQIAALLRT